MRITKTMAKKEKKLDIRKDMEYKEKMGII